uniref:uncharacterized protein LOC120335113 n=1 Tax=Styela clava TaxID=7725 RepID=UPI00193A0DD1|nr:uncharacterized protein LOC120335113 [Styela clava]
MKIICAGLQKTGTKTIAEALRILGYNVHDVFEQFYHEKELWDKILNNTVTVKDYQRILENVDAMTDFPAIGVWEQIYEAFPDAKVILMVRSSEDEWVKSVLKQREVANEYLIIQNDLFRHFRMHFITGPLAFAFHKIETAFTIASLGVPRMHGKPLPEAFLRSRYRQHNSYVKSICPKEKLLIYNVKDGWEPLCKFLDKDVPEKSFPVVNINDDDVHNVWGS